MSEHSSARSRLAMVLMTLGAWLVAFVVVLALLTVLGDELESLPLALRAIVISGVLVSLMANLVMPVLNAAIGRSLSGGPRGQFAPGAPDSSRRGEARRQVTSARRRGQTSPSTR